MSRTSTISLWTSRLHRKKSQWVVDETLLRSLTPLNLLEAADLKELIDRSGVHNVEAGKEIGARGDSSKSTFYLLSGTAELVSHNNVVSTVTAGTEAAKHPVVKPRSQGMVARAKVDCAVLELEADADELLDRLNGSTEYEVSDIRSATDTDWLTCFLQAKVFMRLPPSNIRELLSRMEEMPVTAGQEIMRQGESDDYYYIVKEGRCRVTTKAPSGKGMVEVAELREGDGFGEDALITNGRRSATVTMVNEGSLMRLSKEAFTSLLVEPVLKYVTWEQAQSLMQDGAVLLDVRRPEEYGTDGIDGAVNIPLSMLRSRAHELDADRPHITVSNVLNRSSAAAFFLCQRGMNACILKEGTQIPVAARLQPVQKQEMHDAPSAATAQVTPIHSRTAPKQESADSELKKSLAAVQRDLGREREHKRQIEDQLARQQNELQQLRQAHEVEARAASELAGVKEQLEKTTRHGQDLARQLEEKEQALQGFQQLQAREKDLNDRLADLEQSLDQERSAKHAIEQEMEALREELQRQGQTREEERELREELSSLQGELTQARARAQDLESQHAASQEELRRMQQSHEVDGAIRADLESATQSLAREKEQREALEQVVARRDEELQRLQHVLEVDDELRSELSSVKRALEREGEARQEIEGRLAHREEELHQLRQAQQEDVGVKAELAATRRRLERELELNKVIEKQLERQHREMLRLQEESEAGGAVGAELAEVKARLAGEIAGREEALHKVEAQSEAMRRIEQQMNKFRQRLKKVVALARTAEKKRLDAEKRRHDAEQRAEAAELNQQALRQDLEDRSLRLAEVELERRRLEKSVAAAGAQPSPGSKPNIFLSPGEGEASPPIRVNQYSESSRDADRRKVLQLPSPPDADDAVPRGSYRRSIQRFVTRALIWLVLIGVAVLSLYGVAVTGAFKVKAAPWEGAGSVNGGVMSSLPSLPLKLPFASGNPDAAGGDGPTNK